MKGSARAQDRHVALTAARVVANEQEEKAMLSRRHDLHLLAAGAGALAGPASRATPRAGSIHRGPEGVPAPENGEAFDVVVVGGGFSGVYVARRQDDYLVPGTAVPVSSQTGRQPTRRCRAVGHRC